MGLARTLALIDEIIRMCRESLEGQAIELGWIRKKIVPTRDADYINMVTKKTSWYTCQSPCRLGAIAAGHTRARELDLIGDVFQEVGVAFQIQDDVLNLIGEEDLYGKEALGDLLEGKRTLMLIHLMRTVPQAPALRAPALAQPLARRAHAGRISRGPRSDDAERIDRLRPRRGRSPRGSWRRHFSRSPWASSLRVRTKPSCARSFTT